MSEQIKEDKLAEVVIDLGASRNGTLDESWLRMFGSWAKTLMKATFGGLDFPVKVVGTKKEVESFAKALGREKNYLSAMSKYGLDDRRTYQRKGLLDSAVRGFENTTGIKWPFR